MGFSMSRVIRDRCFIISWQAWTPGVEPEFTNLDVAETLSPIKAASTVDGLSPIVGA